MRAKKLKAREEERAEGRKEGRKERGDERVGRIKGWKLVGKYIWENTKTHGGKIIITRIEILPQDFVRFLGESSSIYGNVILEISKRTYNANLLRYIGERTVKRVRFKKITDAKNFAIKWMKNIQTGEM